MTDHPTQDENWANVKEEELIRRAEERDERALAFIYEQNRDKIYRYVLARIGEPEIAEDLTADVFVRMLDRVSGFRWRGITLSAWLFRMAHNTVVDYLRRRRQGEAAALDRNIRDENSDPTAEVEKALALQEVAAAVHRLTPTQREVIHLRFAGGLSVAETARMLGKNEGTVKVLQYNAIATLRRFLAGPK